ncbi:amidohydrolase family protein [Kordiimonas sp. SCSIO 12610]|uniref:amidohydrolase family protein n=1 Tax=Kordiimonas sp. SCSIO 12610 TaxID=2829597 RepID=UPI00210C29C8|nr:amidohydrolase family protein [Kordiimonas sp. SCSIO 12610]UTW56218.1 PD40 domain-containing protein [Kordiimonas sp. SCSIO 12610]
MVKFQSYAVKTSDLNQASWQSRKRFGRVGVSAIALAASLTVQPLTAITPIAHAVEDTLPFDGKTADKLEFSVSEGTWMSLDLTPDGKTIVFELLGDLYTMPAAGGKATRILDGLGYAAQPRVSPDGKWIAFISDRDGSNNLWVAPFDGGTLGKPRKLSDEAYTKVISPTWMPDSQYVVMSKITRDQGLTMHHIAGGDGLSLALNNGGGAVEGMGATVSPDGRYIYYARNARGFARFPALQIYRFDLESGEEIQITQGEGGGLRPLLSPDGTLLVYATRRDGETGLRLRNLKTGADTPLVWPVQRDSQENFGADRDVLPGYAFTRDGSALLYHTGGKIQEIALGTGEQREIPFTADVSLDIGPELSFSYRVDDSDMVEAQIIHNPTTSPDGSKLAMSALTKIYVMDKKDGTPTRLTKGDAWEFQPVWSPDGKWIAYVTWSMNEGGHIWKMRANGRGKPQKLTVDPAFYTDLAFSKDGKRIVAMRGNEWQRHQTFSEFGGLATRLDLVWLDAKGSDTNVIVAANGARRPHMGPEDDRIYLYDGGALFSLRYDGSDKRDHLIVEGPRGNRNSTEAPTAEDVRMSPDGKHALAFINKQIYVMPLTKIGGDVPVMAHYGGGLPNKRLTDVGADFFGWSDAGNTIYWAIGSTYLERGMDSIDFAPEDGAEDENNADDKKESTSDSKDSDNDSENTNNLTKIVNETGQEQFDSESDSKESEEQFCSITRIEGGTVTLSEEFDCAENPELMELAKQQADMLKAAQPENPALDADESVTATKISVMVPRSKPVGSIVLRGANVIPMKAGTTASMDRVVENQDILITDNRIVAVGDNGTLDVPAGAEVVDVSGKYIMPGFIDTHAHWEFRTQDVLEPQNWSLAANLAYGVTAGLDVQTSHKDYFAYRDMVDTGQSVGQRAFMTGPGIFGNNDFQSYDAVYHYLSRYSHHYGTYNIKSYIAGNRKQRQWVVKAAKAQNLMPTTEGAGDMKLDITHAIDGMHGNEHTLTIAPMYDDVLTLYAETKTAYTPTLLVQYNGISAEEYFFANEDAYGDEKLRRFYPRNRLAELTQRRGIWARDEEYSFDHIASAAADLQRKGGLVGVGGHGELQGLGYHWEMWAMGLGGMTNVEVLRAATIDGAKIIGIDLDLGSIEAGKLADLVVLDKNPLENIRHTNTIKYVMKNGEFYEGDTLNQIWPTKRDLKPFWWWDGDLRAKNSLKE